MKTIIRTAALAFVFAAFAGSASAAVGVTDNAPVYKRTLNPRIGVKAGNQSAVGRSYSIRNQKGRVILSGTIASGETFYIPTTKLAGGAYRFIVDGEVLQEFHIQ